MERRWHPAHGHRRRPRQAGCALLAAGLLFAGCSTPLGVSVPTLETAIPPSGSTIGPRTSILLRFDRAMDPASLSVGGTLAPGAVPSWSTGTEANDTLVLSPHPQSAWPGGAGSFVLGARSAAGERLVALTLSYDVDATIASASAFPASGSVLSIVTPIVVRFSKPMHRGALALGGSLGAAARGAWSRTASEDDTLTLTPLTAWPAGDQTLTVNVQDLVATAVPRLELRYLVDDGPASAVVVPASGAALRPDRPITITFSEPMVTDTLLLDGSLAPLARPQWSSETMLTLVPESAWPAGPGTLGVRAFDRAANATYLPLGYAVDASPPGASTEPADAVITGPQETVAIQFSESMDTATLAVAGPAVPVAWVSTTVPNDRIVLGPPATGWTEGQQIAVNASDLAGHPVGTVRFSVRLRPPSSVLAIEPATHSTIGPRTPLLLRFDRSLDPESLVIAGSMASAASAAWSRTTTADDTLTLTPGSAWPSGSGSLLLDARTPDGGPLGTTTLHYTVDATVPSATALPESGAVLSSLAPILVRFSKSMQPATLILGGGLGATALTDWSTTSLPDDTLVLTPLAAWPVGIQTLHLDAIDVVGTAAPRLTVSYSVDATAPSGSAIPGNGSRIRPDQVLRVVFDEPIDPSTLVLGGSIGPAASSSWISPTEVELSPATSWPLGAATLTVTAADFAGHTSTLSLGYVVDGTSPTATTDPVDRVIVEPRQSLVLQFSESMSPASLAMTGPTGPASWTSASAPNDRLHVSAPVGGWLDGQVVTVDAADLAGNAVATVRFVARPALLAGLPLIDVRLQAVRVANDDGARACPITPAEVTQWVNEANRVYAHANIRLLFDETADFSSLNSTLVNQMMGTGDPQWQEEKTAANAEAARHPGKMVALFRWGSGGSPTGGGFSWTDYNFLAMPGFSATFVCGHQNITLFAHEVGHYLGLAHTFATVYPSIESAAAAYSGDPAVFDGDGIFDTPPDPFVNTGAVQCNGATTVMTLNGTPLLLPRNNIMSYYDSTRMGLSYTQAMRVRQGALVRTGQDIRAILPGTFLPRIEGEVLAGSASASAGGLGPQTNMRAFLGNWTGDAQLWWGGASGATLTLTVSVATAGAYRIWAVLTSAPDFGIHQIFVNGEHAGETVNLYAPTVGHTPPRDLGVHALRSGSNTVLVRNQGKDSRSTGYGLGLDYLLLQVSPL